MTHASLFSGIGGFDLAAEWMGWQNMFWCEKDKFCQQVLKYHFPNSIGYGDIKETNLIVMEKIYLEVDETTIFRGEQIRCVKCEPYSDCSNCCFYFNADCGHFKCYAESRKDGTNVIFHNEGIAPTELIKLVSTAYSKYISSCDMLAETAQVFIDWDDNIKCEYFPSDGICLTTSDAKVCPADSFFEAVKDKDRISKNDFEDLCI